MRWGVVWFWVDSGSFCTAVVSRRRYQKVDVVIFIAFGWGHTLYYNLLAVQLRNSYLVLGSTALTGSPIMEHINTSRMRCFMDASSL